MCIGMLAASYRVNPMGWITSKWLRYVWPGCLFSSLNGLRVRQVPVPQLPCDDWVLLRTLLGGICGSDVAILANRQPPDSLLQAYSSMPMILGHENVAVVESIGGAVDPSWLGRRVCVEPTLCCQVRGIDPPCRHCREGRFSSCEHFGSDGIGRAALPAGMSIGYNSRTGGSWGEYFVAHVSQLVPVPDELTDEQALLTDPVACSLHAVLRAELSGAETVLVYGAGILGLAAVASLRALGCAARLDVVAKYAYQGRLAEQMGADRVVYLPKSPAERFARLAELTGGSVQRARFGNYMLTGGYDVVFDCVGSRRSVAECIKWTRARGQAVLVGAGAVPVDVTAIWFRQLRVLGSWGRDRESLDGRTVGTYELVHELMKTGKLDVSKLLTHTFRLDEYRRALAVAMNKAPHCAVKVAFDFRQ